MADDYVRVAPDSSGKKIQSYINTVGSNTVETQAVVLVDATATPVSGTNALPTAVLIGANANATVAHTATVFESGRVLKSTPGTLFSLTVHTTATNDQFVQYFDLTGIPIDGTVPIGFFTIPARSDASMDIPVVGMPFLNGIVVSNSSTTTTKTSGAQDCWFVSTIV